MNVLLLLAGCTGLAACTGLAVGPETSAVTPVAVSRDSAYVRAKRALQTEVFTLDVQDSAGGQLAGLRYPSANAQAGTLAACRVQLALAIRGGTETSEVATTSRWVAPAEMVRTKGAACEQDRIATIERIQEVIAPTQQ